MSLRRSRLVLPRIRRKGVILVRFNSMNWVQRRVISAKDTLHLLGQPQNNARVRIFENEQALTSFQWGHNVISDILIFYIQ